MGTAVVVRLVGGAEAGLRGGAGAGAGAAAALAGVALRSTESSAHFLVSDSTSRRHISCSVGTVHKRCESSE